MDGSKSKTIVEQGSNELPMSGRFLSVSGTHKEIGLQIGERFRDRVQWSLSKVSDELSAQLSLDTAREKAAAYVPAIERVAPHLLEEIEGVAEGAAIRFEDALILQLRFDLIGFDQGAVEGCSSFAIAESGLRFSGQNVDAPSWHKESGTVIAMYPPNGPAILMYTYYPGMIGYVGINSHGLSVFGNALLSGGWRVGVPRYIAVRLALEQRSVADVHRTLGSLDRGSSINLVVSDDAREVIDLEVDVDEIGVVHPHRSRIFHTNHYLTPSLRGGDQVARLLPDSLPRLQTGRKALGKIDTALGKQAVIGAIKTLLRDHSDGPASICRHRAPVSEYPADQWESVASIIADPEAGSLHVSFGNPCEVSYQRFALDYPETRAAGTETRASNSGYR